MIKIRTFLSQALRGAAFMLAAGSAVAGVAAQAGRWNDKLDGLTHFALLWLLAGLAAIVLWLIASRRMGLTPILAILAIACSGGLIAPDVIAALRQKPVPLGPETLKIVQFNVYEWNMEVERTAAWIKAQNADIVIAEEVHDRGLWVIKEIVGDYPYHTPCLGRDWCGTVILSRRTPTPNAKEIKLEEGNGKVAFAQFTGPTGRPYSVMGVHYVWPEPASPQWINRRAMRRNIKAFPQDGMILTGDFNSTPWSFALQRQDRDLGLTRWTRATPTWPVRIKGVPLIPFLPLDHVYTGKDWRLVSVERGPRLGSDHQPIIIVLTR